jgi:Ca-activated chloride channel homolog
MVPLRSRWHLCVSLLLTSLLLSASQQDPQKQPSPSPSEDAPASIGLLLDNSGSMAGKQNAAVGALQELVKASNPKDEFFVVNFNDDPYLDVDFTSDSKSVFEALGRADARSGTSINDTVIAAADHLAKGAKYKKRALVLLTDGIDNSSHMSVKDMLKDLHKPGMPAVYCILLFDSGKAVQARKPLDRLAQETGGKAFYPGNEAQLNEMARQIAQEIRNR